MKKEKMFTPAKGQEQYTRYLSKIHDKYMIWYDYRDEMGHLFTTVTPTLKEARRQRDDWLQRPKERVRFT